MRGQLRSLDMDGSVGLARCNAAQCGSYQFGEVALGIVAHRMLLAENLVKLLIIRRTMRDLAIDGENGENSCSHFEADPLNCAV